jgi:hypothetical protein
VVQSSEYAACDGWLALPTGSTRPHPAKSTFVITQHSGVSAMCYLIRPCAKVSRKDGPRARPAQVLFWLLPRLGVHKTNGDKKKKNDDALQYLRYLHVSLHISTHVQISLASRITPKTILLVEYINFFLSLFFSSLSCLHLTSTIPTLGADLARPAIWRQSNQIKIESNQSIYLSTLSSPPSRHLFIFIYILFHCSHLFLSII